MVPANAYCRVAVLLPTGSSSMNRMRVLLVGLAAATLVACNQNAAAPANPLAGDPNVNGWSNVQAADLGVPRGVHYGATNVGGAVVAEISGVPDDALSTGKTGGVSVRVPAAIETQASGGSVRVVVRAYASQEGSELGLAYSTNDVGNSGWLRYPLTQTPADYVFNYVVPRMQHGNGDYLGFRSYGTAAVRIVGFKVEATPAAAPPAANLAPPALRPTTPPAP